MILGDDRYTAGRSLKRRVAITGSAIGSVAGGFLGARTGGAVGVGRQRAQLPAKRPPPRVSDLEPHHAQCSAARLHAIRARVRKTMAHADLEAARPQGRLGASAGTAGEHFKRAALVGCQRHGGFSDWTARLRRQYCAVIERWLPSVLKAGIHLPAVECSNVCPERR